MNFYFSYMIMDCVLILFSLQITITVIIILIRKCASWNYPKKEENIETVISNQIIPNERVIQFHLWFHLERIFTLALSFSLLLRDCTVIPYIVRFFPKCIIIITPYFPIEITWNIRTTHIWKKNRFGHCFGSIKRPLRA